MAARDFNLKGRISQRLDYRSFDFDVVAFTQTLLLFDFGYKIAAM